MKASDKVYSLQRMFAITATAVAMVVLSMAFGEVPSVAGSSVTAVTVTNFLPSTTLPATQIMGTVEVSGLPNFGEGTVDSVYVELPSTNGYEFTEAIGVPGAIATPGSVNGVQSATVNTSNTPLPSRLVEIDVTFNGSGNPGTIYIPTPVSYTSLPSAGPVNLIIWDSVGLLAMTQVEIANVVFGSATITVENTPTITTAATSSIGALEIQENVAGAIGSSTDGDVTLTLPVGCTWDTSSAVISDCQGWSPPLTSSIFSGGGTSQLIITPGKSTSAGLLQIWGLKVNVPFDSTLGSLVVNLGGASSGTLTIATVTSAPTVSGISPVTGPSTGGTPVTVSGTGLSTVSAVYFGSSVVASTYDTANGTLTTTSPQGAGCVSINVYSDYYGETTSGPLFTYYSVSNGVYSVNDTGQNPNGGPVTVNLPSVPNTGSITVTLGDNVSLQFPAGTNAPSTVTVQQLSTQADNEHVFQFTTNGGGWSFGQSISITLPVPSDVTNPCVYYLNSNGHLVLVTDHTYNNANGTITFTTDHFSKYVVAQYTSNTTSGGGGGVSPQTLALITVLPGGTVGQPYRQSFTTNGEGTPPYSFSVSNGSMPSGLALDSSTGVISGTPTTAGTYTFTLTVKDANNNSAGETYHLTVAPPPLTLTDIAGNWAQANIEKLVSLGVITGYPDGTFRPDNDITRAEFVTLLVKALQVTPKASHIFVDTEGNWTRSYISTAVAYGIVSGYDATHLGPNDLITREQMTAMVVRAAKAAPVTGRLSFTDGALIDAWASGYVITAVADGIVNGYPDGTFRPLGYATRGEAVTVIARILK